MSSKDVVGKETWFMRFFNKENISGNVLERKLGSFAFLRKMKTWFMYCFKEKLERKFGSYFFKINNETYADDILNSFAFKREKNMFGKRFWRACPFKGGKIIGKRFWKGNLGHLRGKCGGKLQRVRGLSGETLSEGKDLYGGKNSCMWLSPDHIYNDLVIFSVFSIFKM